MIWVLPLDAVNVLVGELFVFAAGYRDEYARALALAAAVQFALSLALVLPLGAYGVAGAFLAAMLCMATLLLRAAARIRRTPDGDIAGTADGTRDGALA